MFVALPRTTTLYIAKEAIPPITQAAGYRGQRVYPGMIDGAGKQRAEMASVSIGPGIIAGNADDLPDVQAKNPECARARHGVGMNPFHLS
jgi:hypothetical protein